MTRLRALFSSRAAIVTISILAAIALWYYENTTNNPVETREYKLSMLLLNTDKLAAGDRFLSNAEVLSSQTVSVKIRTNRKAHEQLTIDKNAGRLYAYVDFSVAYLLNSTGQTKTWVELGVPDRYVTDEALSLERVSISPDTVIIDFDTIEEKTLTIRPRLTGDISADSAFSAERIECSPDKVTIRGPSVEINRIMNAEVAVDPPKIDVSSIGSPDEYHVTGTLRPLDRNGSPVSDGHITFGGVNAVEVSYNVVKAKEIPVVATDVTGEPADGFALNTYDPITDYEPKTVWVKGAKRDVDEIVHIKLNPADVTGLTAENATVADNLRRYLSDFNARLEFVNPSGTDVTIIANIEPLMLKQFRFPPDKIELMGEASEYARLADAFDAPITLRARKSLLTDETDITAIVKATADVTFLSYAPPGEYELPVKFDINTDYELVTAPAALRVVVLEPPPVVDSEEGDGEGDETEPTEPPADETADDTDGDDDGTTTIEIPEE